MHTQIHTHTYMHTELDRDTNAHSFPGAILLMHLVMGVLFVEQVLCIRYFTSICLVLNAHPVRLKSALLILQKRKQMKAQAG